MTPDQINLLSSVAQVSRSHHEKMLARAKREASPMSEARLNELAKCYGDAAEAIEAALEDAQILSTLLEHGWSVVSEGGQFHVVQVNSGPVIASGDAVASAVAAAMKMQL